MGANERGQLMKANINPMLDKGFGGLAQEEAEQVTEALLARILFEFNKQDKSGMYGISQYQMAYNSNRIEGSQLTENQTVSLFETGTITADGETFCAKDIEEATGHFLMFNHMLQTYSRPLTEELVKTYHFKLKSGVFEDAANGYAVGDYKTRPNRIGSVTTALPHEVPGKMRELFVEYEEKEKIGLKDLAEFHLRYERIHPFQDGNGRTGRIILFKECLGHKILPFIIYDRDKAAYYRALNENNAELLTGFFQKEQEEYFKNIRYFLYEYVRDEPAGRS